MLTAIIITAISFCVVCIFVAWACCIAGSRADDDMDEACASEGDVINVGHDINFNRGGHNVI